MIFLKNNSAIESSPAIQASVVALAGRRIDAIDAEPRFPLRNMSLVEERLRRFLGKSARALVCSAACGTDLLALEVASELGIRRRVVLPYDRVRFYETSVADRPGDWSERYNHALDDIEARGDLVVLRFQDTDPIAYARTNLAILDEARQIAQASGMVAEALVVWDGKNKGTGDFTAQFLNAAQKRGMVISELLTTGREANDAVSRRHF